MCEPLRGHLAPITGATGGIGAAIAHTLAANGAAVALAHHADHQAAAQMVKAIERHGGTATSLDADLRTPAAPATLYTATKQAIGTPDILISAAGAYPRTPWADLDHQQWQDSLAINLTAHHLLAQAAAPAMIERGRGRIITIGSVLASHGRHHLAAYIAAKAGLEGLTRALARELGPQGITVNCIAPGSIRVPAEDAVVDDPIPMEQRQFARQCLKRRGDPDDVAHAAAFLADPAAGFITGQTLRVDGGWVLA